MQRVAVDTAPKSEPIALEAKPVAAATQVTMLSIRSEPADVQAVGLLSMQCRTSLTISNSRDRTVSIHGVVTQEIVSPAGRILIMAGSHVVGSGTLDYESGRLRSDGIWTIIFDNTVMKVRALLRDRPEGLLGVIGKVKSPDFAVSATRIGSESGKLVVIPVNTAFTLELHGEIQLRDLASNESEN